MLNFFLWFILNKVFKETFILLINFAIKINSNILNLFSFEVRFGLIFQCFCVNLNLYDIVFIQCLI